MFSGLYHPSYLFTLKLFKSNMKKLYAKIKSQTIKELEKEIAKLRHEIAKGRLELKVNPPKDTNSIFKKRKTLAVYLTVLTEKIDLEKLQKVA